MRTKSKNFEFPTLNSFECVEFYHNAKLNDGIQKEIPYAFQYITKKNRSCFHVKLFVVQMHDCYDFDISA